LALFAGDFFLVCLSTFLGALMRLGQPINVFRTYTGASLIFLTSFLVMAYIFDVYDSECIVNRYTRFVRLSAVWIVSFFISSASFYFLPGYRYGRGIFLLSVLLAGALAYGWRDLYGKYASVLVGSIPTGVVGMGHGAERLQTLLNRARSAYQFKGFIQTTEDRGRAGDPGRPVLGEIDRLDDLVRENQLQCLVMLSRGITPAQASELTRLKFEGVSIYDALEFSMRAGEAIPLEFLQESWLWFTEGFQLPRSRLTRQILRFRDVVLASLGLLISLPLSLLLALAIKLESRGPVFVIQDRVGVQEEPFRMIKFRSMYVGAEKDQPLWTAVNDRRVTRVGRIMRVLHLDEIPQMINVLRGDMSFIGPRPERPAFVDELKGKIPFYHLRHYVRPGITGWAQVNFPYSSSLEETRAKLEYDLYYVVNASFLLDLRILLRTFRVVLHRRGSR
jgi:exopolysaccharide biosynthesis polyprenyl glycosylphosphotransferase